MQVSRDTVWSSLSEFERRRIQRRASEISAAVESKLEEWRKWIEPLDHTAPGLPEELIGRLRAAYTAAEIAKDALDAVRRTGGAELLLERVDQVCRTWGRELDVVSRELFGPPGLHTILDPDASDEVRLAAASQLTEDFGSPLYRLERRRLNERNGVRDRSKFEAARRKNLSDAERMFAADTPGDASDWRQRARTWAMLRAVLGLREPRARLWMRGSDHGKLSFDCDPPFAPYDQTFWPILRLWLWNDYTVEYRDQLDVDPDDRDNRFEAISLEASLEASESLEGTTALVVAPCEPGADPAQRISDDLLRGIPLSADEYRVARLVELGYSSIEAAQALGLNDSYPRGWRAQMRAKLARAGRLPD